MESAGNKRKPDPTDHACEHAFLLRCAELLHLHGTPAHRLERVMVKMAKSLGIEATFLYTPTSVSASFGRMPNDATHIVRIESGTLDLGRLVTFDEVMEDVEKARIDVGEGLARLEAVAAAPPYWNAAWKTLAFALASASAARFFGGGPGEVALSFALGPLLFLLAALLPARSSEPGLYEPVSAFVGALAALLFARYAAPIDDRVVTLSTLIVLLPGLTLTTAMTELATHHLVSGVARLAGAAMVFLTILLGVALAWRLWGGPVAGIAAAGTSPLPAWSLWVAVVVTPFAFSVILKARVREFPAIYAAALGGFGASRFCAAHLGSDLAPFAGALVVGLASNLYARVANRPAIVPLTPGILLLVPGSLGYRSLTSFLDREALTGMDWAFQTGVVAVALVGGTLAANVIVPPRRVL